MRTINRLHAIVFLAICSLVYVAWVLPTLRVQSRFQKVLSGSPSRLVVFGDSYSDTGVYKVAVPKTNPQANASHPLWTEALCAELLCDTLENYARSSGSLDFKAHPDALVDTDVVANVTNQNPSNAKFKADFGLQVQRWINSEQQRLNRTGVQERTVFTVFFGISDVWQFVGLEDKDAHEGVRQSIRSLFAQLDVVAQFMRKPIQVVLPHIPDITFLPAFSQQPEGPFPTYQRSAVFLVEKWNTELERAAREFVGGSIHLLSMNKWLLAMLREQQMYTIGIADENGDGKRAPTFTETTNPCLPLPALTGAQYPFDMDDADSNRTEPCTDPSHYLFWDGMHLSSKAHRLLALEAADLVSHNDTFNLNALRKHEQELAEEKEKQEKPDAAEMDSTDSES